MAKSHLCRTKVDYTHFLLYIFFVNANPVLSVCVNMCETDFFFFLVSTCF